MDRAGHGLPSCGAGLRRRRRAAGRPRRRSGRRTCWEWVARGARPAGAGGVLVPLNTRFKGTEAAWILERSRARVAGHRQRLPRHRLRRDAPRASGGEPTAPAPACPTSARSWCCARRRPPTAPAWDDFLAAGAEVRPAEVDARARRPRARRPLRHALHLGHHRQAEGRAQHPRADPPRLRGLGGHRWACAPATATWSSTRSSTPSATRPASWPRSCTGATLLPARRCSTPPRCSSASRPRPHHRAARAAHAATRRSSTTPTSTSSTSRRCAWSVTGAAAIPVELIQRDARRARLRDGRHRLRPHRGMRLRHHVPAGTTTAETIATTSGRAMPGIEVRVVDDDGGRGRRAARPGEVVVRGLQRDARLLRGPGADRGGHRRPTAGCTPATSA